uniref:Uncharacterized protein n=1 Tax=Oryza glumipatula TaxID=40148 RepID=A0A0E0A0Y2_9ORYZ
MPFSSIELKNGLKPSRIPVPDDAGGAKSRGLTGCRRGAAESFAADLTDGANPRCGIRWKAIGRTRSAPRLNSFIVNARIY